MNSPSLAIGVQREIALPGQARRILHNTGLLPTRHRIALTGLLLTASGRWVTAEILYDEARRMRYSVSRATVCNTLRQFERAGLLRRIPVRKSRKVWFAVHPRAIGKTS
jgi:Fur family iron response transcriptional regulator